MSNIDLTLLKAFYVILRFITNHSAPAAAECAAIAVQYDATGSSNAPHGCPLERAWQWHRLQEYLRGEAR